MTHVAEDPKKSARPSTGLGRSEALEGLRTHYVAEYGSVTRHLGSQPSWLRHAREHGLEAFERLGFPTTRLEDWKFTSVAPIAERPFALASDGAARISRAELAAAALPGPVAATAVCVNGRFNAQLSSLGGVSNGVQLFGLAEALATHPELMERYLARLAPVADHAFTALNTAFLVDAVVVIVQAEAVIEAPIHVLFVSLAPDGAASVAHPRLLVIAGEGCQAQIVERYIGRPSDAAGSTFTNAVTEIALSPNAVVDHYKLQEEAAQALHVGGQHVRGSRSSTFSSHSITFGGAVVRNDVLAVLDGEGIDCTLNGLYFASGRQLVDNHTTIDHARAHCSSHEIYKGILADRARAVFNGKIIVRPDAQKTDAKQTNKALLLSDDAQVNTKPQLEIFANDVKCTHGAAIGQLDDDAIFYLRSRGLEAAEARRILIHAFASDILDRVKPVPVREHLEAALAARLSRSAA